MRKSRLHTLAALLALLLVFVASQVFSGASAVPQAGRGTIGSGQQATVSGQVTADRGQVRGFRVKFRHTVHRMTYTVFTRAGGYHISNLPPGPYEVRVMEPNFESPIQKIELAAGESRTINLALKAVAPRGGVELVDMDVLFPPGPGRDVLMSNCLGCHGKLDERLRVPRRRDGPGSWAEKIRMMTTAEHSPGSRNVPAVPDMTNEQQALLVDYLATHFGPNAPLRDLRRDPFQVDEDAIADALYIEYELPPVDAPPFKDGGARRRGLHDVNVLSDQTIWAGGLASGSLLHMNPRETDFRRRFKEYFVDAPYNVGVRGVVEDKRGRYYWSEGNRDSHLGELDPVSGAMKRYPMLSPGYMHSLIADSKGNVWYTQFWGSKLGKLDARTRTITEYPVPVVGADLYDVVVDKNDHIWTSGVGKDGAVFRFDPVAEKFTVYPTPTKPSGPRRLAVDSSGKVWIAESGGDRLGMIQPTTGDVVEYPLPLRYTRPYAVWELGNDIWISDEHYSALIKFDQETKTFMYYPLPTPGTGTPIVRVDKEGTSWFATRGANQQIVAFKPRGNAMSRPPSR